VGVLEHVRGQRDAAFDRPLLQQVSRFGSEGKSRIREVAMAGTRIVSLCW
jgi:hypothetical protein